MNTDPLIVSLRQPKREASAVPESVPRPRALRRFRVWWLVVAVALVLLVGGVYGAYAYPSFMEKAGGVGRFFSKPEVTPAAGAASGEDALAQVDDLVAEVGRLIVLPENEVPTVATVTEPEKLKDQLFFANAKMGDKVLLYTEAKKAYLYDPVAKKLIEVAPITTELQ
ncbi:MAG: hypothetical protein KBE09_03515 [Candidatus Pacebacteria bacterium]|nr:hypothetical protein [Candidatus Paceibacterota bacterium]